MYMHVNSCLCLSICFVKEVPLRHNGSDTRMRYIVLFHIKTSCKTQNQICSLLRKLTQTFHDHNQHCIFNDNRQQEPYLEYTEAQRESRAQKIAYLVHNGTEELNASKALRLKTQSIIFLPRCCDRHPYGPVFLYLDLDGVCI